MGPASSTRTLAAHTPSKAENASAIHTMVNPTSWLDEKGSR